VLGDGGEGGKGKHSETKVNNKLGQTFGRGHIGYSILIVLLEFENRAWSGTPFLRSKTATIVHPYSGPKHGERFFTVIRSKVGGKLTARRGVLL
jgi:hypothetical protein